MSYKVIQNGDQITIPVKAKNNGTGIEPNASVELTIPTGLTLVSATPNKGTFAGTTWTVGKLNPGDDFTLNLIVEVNDLSQAPFSISSIISGTTIDTVSGNNTINYSIEKVSDLFTATATDDDNLSLSFDLSENDIECNYCETKWTITAPSVSNGTVLSFDENTGKGEFRFTNPTLDGSFQYTISCHNCGDGIVYNQDTAMATFPALFDGSWIPSVGGDVSTLTQDPDGTDIDVFRHSAGGVDTDFDISKYKVTGGTFSVSNDNKLTITLEDGSNVEIDMTELVDHTQIQSIYLSGNTLHIVEGSGILSNNRSIDLTPILGGDPVTNASLSLVGNELVLTDSEMNVVSEDLSSIIVTGISVDESTAPTKTITITFADGSIVTGSFTDDVSGGGGGDNWGTQVVQSDSTLDGDGTGSDLLRVSPANNPMVSSFEIDGSDNLVLTLTDGTVLTLTNAAMKAAFDTDTNTTILTDFDIVGNVLRITDDSGIKTVDLTPILTTSIAWVNITGKPTLTENGGNVTGFINLSTGEFALTAPDSNDNDYVDGASIVGTDLIITRTGSLPDLTVDLSSFMDDTDNYVNGVSFVGNILTLQRTGSLPDLTIDLNSLDVTNTALSITNVGELVTITVTDSNGGTVSDTFNFCDTCDPIDWTEVTNKPTLTDGAPTDGNGNIKGTIPLDGGPFDLEMNVNTDDTLSGTGAPGLANKLSVDPNNNPMVDSIELNQDIADPQLWDFVINLTDGTTRTISGSDMLTAYNFTALTSASYNNATGELSITDDKLGVTADLSDLKTNNYIEDTTALVGNNLVIQRQGLPSFNVDLSGLIPTPSSDVFIQSGLLSGTDLILTLNDASTVTIDLSALANTDTTNESLVSSIIGTSIQLTLTDSEGDNVQTTFDVCDLCPDPEWTDVKNKPNLTDGGGGNVNGGIDLSAGTFDLTAPDNNDYVDGVTLSSSGDELTVSRTGSLPDILVDMSVLQNKEELITLSQTVIPYNEAIGAASNIAHKSQFVVPFDAKVISFTFSFANFEGAGTSLVGAVNAGDVGNKRINLNHYDYSSGADLENSTTTTAAHITVVSGHSKEVLMPNKLSVQAGDVLSFEIVNNDGSPIASALQTEGFSGSIMLEIDETNNASNTVTASN